MGTTVQQATKRDNDALRAQVGRIMKERDGLKNQKESLEMQIEELKREIQQQRGFPKDQEEKHGAGFPLPDSKHSATATVTAHQDNSRNGQALRQSERRCAQLLVRNTMLEEELRSYKEYMKLTVARFQQQLRLNSGVSSRDSPGSSDRLFVARSSMASRQ